MMKVADLIVLIGFGMALIWSILYTCLENDKKKIIYVIWAGIIIDVILLAISRSQLALFGGVFGGIFLGSVKAGANYISAKVGLRGRYGMQGWKNWVILSIIFWVMLISSGEIAVIIQENGNPDLWFG